MVGRNGEDRGGLYHWFDVGVAAVALWTELGEERARAAAVRPRVDLRGEEVVQLTQEARGALK